MMLVKPLYFETKRRRKVFFVSDHHIYKRCELSVDLFCPGLAANSLPKAVSEIQVVRHHNAVTFRRLHCFFRNARGAFRQCAEDAAGMKPARALFTENPVPVDVAWTKL